MNLYRQTRHLLEWADSRHITLVPRHILGLLNVIANRLPRRYQVINAKWTLSPQVLHHVWHLWEQRDIATSLPPWKSPDCLRTSHHYQTWKGGESMPFPFFGKTYGCTGSHFSPSSGKFSDGYSQPVARPS